MDPPINRPKLTRGQKALLIAGAILILAMGLLTIGLDPSKAKPKQAPKPKAPAPPAVSALTKSPPSSDIPHKTATIALAKPPERAFDPFEEWPLAKILDHFMVPPGRFEADSISDALAELEAIYAEHSDGRTLGIAGVPRELGHRIRFDHDNVSFSQLLQMVAALGGYEADWGTGAIALSPRPVDPLGDELVEFSLDAPFAMPEPDPFGLDDSLPDIALARQHFAELGFEFGDGAGVALGADGRLLITQNANDAARLQSFEDARFNVSPQQVYVTQKLVSVDNGADIEPFTFTSDGDYQLAIRALSQQRGVNILSTPFVVTRPGQQATIEIGREIIYPTSTDANGEPSDFEVRMAGLRIDINPILAGLDRAYLEGTAGITTVGDQALRDTISIDPEAQENIGEHDFIPHITDFSGQIFDGATTLIPVAQEGDTSVYQYTTVSRIDPSGQPILPPAP